MIAVCCQPAYCINLTHTMLLVNVCLVDDWCCLMVTMPWHCVFVLMNHEHENDAVNTMLLFGLLFEWWWFYAAMLLNFAIFQLKQKFHMLCVDFDWLCLHVDCMMLLMIQCWKPCCCFKCVQKIHVKHNECCCFDDYMWMLNMLCCYMLLFVLLDLVMDIGW